MKTRISTLTLILLSATAIAPPVACKKNDIHPTPVSSCKIYSIVDSLPPVGNLTDRVEKRLYSYDNAGNIAAIVDSDFEEEINSGTRITTNDQHFQFDAQGYLKSSDWLNSVTAGGATAINFTLHMDYTYDKGRLIKKTGTKTYNSQFQIVGDTSYAYDQAGHLVTYSYGGDTASYEYTSGALSRITLSANGVAGNVYTIVTDNKGRIVKVIDSQSEESFQFDANGNLTQLAYKYAGNLVSTDSYEYDNAPNPEKPLSPDYKGFPNQQYISPYIGVSLPPVPVNNYTSIKTVGHPGAAGLPVPISTQTFTNTYEPVHHSLVKMVSIVGNDNSTQVKRSYTYTGCP